MKILIGLSLLPAVLACACDYPERYKPLYVPPVPVICGVDIILPAGTIIEGETIQGRAYLILGTGRKKPAESVSWESLDADIIAADRNGMITGLRPGIGTVSVTAGRATASARIEVVRRIDYSRIMIREVFYDAVGSDEGREFIELYNDNEYPCVIAGMMVTDGAAASRAFVFPEGSVIGGKSCCVVAQSADDFFDLFGRNADYSGFSFSLNNSGETVLLKLSDGSILDAVYIRGGTDDFRPPESWGSTTLPAAPAGESVYRINCSGGAASVNWASGAPTPGL